MATNSHTFVGTAGGTFLSIVPNLQSGEIVKTIVLATVGAIVSFAISLVLKWGLRKRRK